MIHALLYVLIVHLHAMVAQYKANHSLTVVRS